MEGGAGKSRGKSQAKTVWTNSPGSQPSALRAMFRPLSPAHAATDHSPSSRLRRCPNPSPKGRTCRSPSTTATRLFAAIIKGYPPRHTASLSQRPYPPPAAIFPSLMVDGFPHLVGPCSDLVIGTPPKSQFTSVSVLVLFSCSSSQCGGCLFYVLRIPPVDSSYHILSMQRCAKAYT